MALNAGIDIEAYITAPHWVRDFYDIAANEAMNMRAKAKEAEMKAMFGS